jgi:succinoglycan biosynthesis protein ExoO
MGLTMSVSVIVAAYNAQETIKRALASALNQTRPPREIIVVDDVSTDETRAVVRAMAAESGTRIRLIESSVNKGPSGSRNAAIRAAQGKWVAILDADDAWCPNRLETMTDAAVRFDADIVTDNQLLYDAGSGEVTRTGFSPDRGTRWIKPIDAFEQEIKLGAEFSYGILKPLIRKQFLDEHQLAYNEGVRYGEDLLFLSAMLLSGARAVLIPEPLYIYTTRVGDRSGVASPHSRSVPRFDLFADGIDALRSKHPQAISPAVDRAITKISRRFRLEHQANLAREARQRGGLLAYALCAIREPAVLLQAFQNRIPKRGPRKVVE